MTGNAKEPSVLFESFLKQAEEFGIKNHKSKAFADAALCYIKGLMDAMHFAGMAGANEDIIAMMASVGRYEEAIRSIENGLRRKEAA
jgi:hypothetical protein